jgi:hypothetical protein
VIGLFCELPKVRFERTTQGWRCRSGPGASSLPRAPHRQPLSPQPLAPPLTQLPTLSPAPAAQLVISEWGIGGGTQDGNSVAPNLDYVAGGCPPCWGPPPAAAWAPEGLPARGAPPERRGGLLPKHPLKLGRPAWPQRGPFAPHRASPSQPSAPRLPLLRPLVPLRQLQEPLAAQRLQRLPVRPCCSIVSRVSPAQLCDALPSAARWLARPDAGTALPGTSEPASAHHPHPHPHPLPAATCTR